MNKRIRNSGLIAMIIVLLGVALLNSNLFNTTPTVITKIPAATATTVAKIPTSVPPTATVTPSPVHPKGPQCTRATANQVAFSRGDHNGFVVTNLQPLHVGECIPSGVKVIDAGGVAHALTPGQGVSTFQGESPLHLVTHEQMREHLAQGLSSRDFLALELEDGTVLNLSEHGTLQFQTPLSVVKIWTGNNSGAIRFSTRDGGSGLIDTAKYWRGASIQSLTGYQSVAVSNLTVYIAPALLRH
jgi:hypothetical protein